MAAVLCSVYRALVRGVSGCIPSFVLETLGRFDAALGFWPVQNKSG